MSEYWKSTPKYWCKHCKAFVRDTKLERQNHDATPRHQGNLKRFLRDLHRGHEKEEKDKERAKSEVARLNGLVSGISHGESSGSRSGPGPTPFSSKPQATPSQRKQQLAQLAEMGVSIPGEFRGEMAMAGEWEVTLERIIDPEEGQGKVPQAIGFGVRKRTAPDEEDDAEVSETKKRRWGSTYLTHPTEEDIDLDALFNKTTGKVRAGAAESEVKRESYDDPSDDSKPLAKVENRFGDNDKLRIKKEPTDGETMLPELSVPPLVTTSQHEDNSGSGSVQFKKRKAKNMRQK